MTFTSLHLNIHQEAVIRAEGLPLAAARALTARYRLFVTDHPNSAADLILEPLAQPVFMPSSAEQTHILFGFHIGEWCGEPAIHLFRRGQADLVIPLSPPMRIFFRPIPGIQRRLQWALAFCLWRHFAQKGLLLLHGAFLEKEERRILLAGHRGSKKTLLTLCLLRQGWNLLTDDKALIRHRTALPFAPPGLILHSHHFALFPWLRNASREKPLVTRWTGLRRLTRSLVLRHLPARFHPTLDRLANPQVQVALSDLFPDRCILSQSRPDTAILLLPGEPFSLHALSRDEGRRRMGLVASLAYEEFSTLSDMAALYHPAWQAPDIQDLIDTQMPVERFLLAHIPHDADFEQVAEALGRC